MNYLTKLNFSTKTIKNADLEFYRKKTLDPSFQGVVFSYLYQVLYMNSINQEEFEYLIAKEKFLTNQLVLYFQRNHFLTEKFTDQIGAFHESGLIKRFMQKYVDFKFLKSRKHAKNRSPMSLKHLIAVFQVYLLGIFLSILVFLCEKCLISVGKNFKSSRVCDRKKSKQQNH